MKMELSINTDYSSGRGNPFPELVRISDHGFSHVQWIHHWNTDFFYMESEIDEIEKQMEELSLKLNESHATKGIEKVWFAPEEYRRKAGVELIKNRVDMTKRLGGDCIVLHPFGNSNREIHDTLLKQGLKSLHELEAYCLNSGIKIALENLLPVFTIDAIEYYFDHFSPEFLGFCWDTGHSNITGPEVYQRIEKICQERLCALHLSDNDGQGKDQHLIPYDGTCNWEWVAEVVKNSSYKKNKPFTIEVSADLYDDIDRFLTKAKEIAEKLTQMMT